MHSARSPRLRMPHLKSFSAGPQRNIPRQPLRTHVTLAAGDGPPPPDCTAWQPKVLPSTQGLVASFVCLSSSSVHPVVVWAIPLTRLPWGEVREAGVVLINGVLDGMWPSRQRPGGRFPATTHSTGDPIVRNASDSHECQCAIRRVRILA